MSSAFAGLGSARTERTSYDTHWVLPSNRYDHIVNNPTTQIAQNHVNKNMIPPVWTKVTRTPWEKPANLCGGYGRKMQNTSVSIDAPVYFLNPDRMIEKFYANHPESKPEVINRRSALFKRTESAHVLPGGMNLLAATEKRPKTAGPRTRMVPYGKQTYSMEIPSTKVYKESRLPPVPTQYMRTNSARTTSRSELSAL